MKTLYGFYSEKQSKHTGVLEYKTPDGKTVQVTEVSEGAGSDWPDKVSRGEVTDYVRQVRTSTDCEEETLKLKFRSVKPKRKVPTCGKCGSDDIYKESDAEGWVCNSCGSSDSDE